MGLPSTVNDGGAAVDERGVVDGSVLGLPAEFAEEGIDRAAGGGVAAFAADFDKGHASFFGCAGFGRVVEPDHVVDFEEPHAASAGGGFRGALRTGRP